MTTFWIPGRYVITKGLTGRWEIWLTSPHTGSKLEPAGSYDNRGHAVQRCRGLNNRASR